MKNSIFISCLAFCTMVLSCESPEKLENSVTNQHLRVQGIPVRIVPPAGHLLDMNDPGFYSNHSFIIMESSDLTLDQLQIKFSDTLLSKQGISTVDKQSLLINNYQGKKLLLKENVNGVAYAKTLLLFGDGTNSVVVNGTYPADSIRLATLIETSMKTLIYEPKSAGSDSTSVYFHFPDPQGFKMISILNAGVKLTNTGYEAWEANDAFLDGYVQLMFVAEQNRMEFINQSISYLGTAKANAQISEVTLAGIPGFEVTDTDEQRMMYRIYLFSDQKVYQIVAAARVDHEAYLAKFRTITANMVLLQ